MASLGSTLAFVLTATFVFVLVLIAEYCNRKKRKKELSYYQRAIVEYQEDDFDVHLT